MVDDDDAADADAAIGADSGREKLILIPSWEEAAGKCKARLDLHSRQLKLDSRLSTMEITSLILRRNLIACSSRCCPRRWVD